MLQAFITSYEIKLAVLCRFKGLMKSIEPLNEVVLALREDPPIAIVIPNDCIELKPRISL